MKELSFEKMEGVKGGELNTAATFACGMGVAFIGFSFVFGGLGGIGAITLIGEATGLACVAAVQ